MISASILRIMEAFNLIELLIGFKLYVFVLKMFQIAGLLSSILLVGLFVSCHIYSKKNTDCPGVVGLGAEVSDWLLKFDIAYLGVTIVKQLILFLRFQDYTSETVKGPVAVVCYLLQEGWLHLILGAVLILIHTSCKRLCRRK